MTQGIGVSDARERGGTEQDKQTNVTGSDHDTPKDK